MGWLLLKMKWNKNVMLWLAPREITRLRRYCSEHGGYEFDLTYSNPMYAVITVEDHPVLYKRWMIELLKVWSRTQ